MGQLVLWSETGYIVILYSYTHNHDLVLKKHVLTKCVLVMGSKPCYPDGIQQNSWYSWMIVPPNMVTMGVDPFLYNLNPR